MRGSTLLLHASIVFPPGMRREATSFAMPAPKRRSPVLDTGLSTSRRLAVILDRLLLFINAGPSVQLVSLRV
jgi:hypothetical protein